jgi:hypothetical protein
MRLTKILKHIHRHGHVAGSFGIHSPRCSSLHVDIYELAADESAIRTVIDSLLQLLRPLQRFPDHVKHQDLTQSEGFDGNSSEPAYGGSRSIQQVDPRNFSFADQILCTRRSQASFIDAATRETASLRGTFLFNDRRPFATPVSISTMYLSSSSTAVLVISNVKSQPIDRHSGDSFWRANDTYGNAR